MRILNVNIIHLWVQSQVRISDGEELKQSSFNSFYNEIKQGLSSIVSAIDNLN